MKKTTKRILGLVLCLAMVLSMLPVLALAAGETTTVYCQVPDSWTTCKAYWWGSTTGTNPGWPGETMTEVEDGIWSFDVPSDATGLIFNNGSGTQTANLTVPTDDKVMYVFANSYWTVYGKVEVVTEYYVAGSAGLCGVEWSPNAAANKMADPDGDGVYTITYSNIAAGKYEFKITNGTWAESWGLNGGNANQPLELTAESNSVDIRFNSETHLLKVIVNGHVVVDDGDVPEIPEGAYFVAGDFNSWNCADAGYQMVDNGDNTYTLSFDVTAGDHQLKVTNGTWDVSWGDATASGNFEITAVTAGTVTVSFDGENVTITGDCLGEAEKEELVINSVHLVGAEGLTGADWDPAANEMSIVDGFYVITFENVAAGTYEFKFAANGTWDINWASGVPMESTTVYDAWFNAMGNSSVVIPADGAIVTLMLDLNAMDPYTGEGAKCAVVIEGVELPDPPAAIYYVTGTFNDWNPGNEDYKMTDEDNDGIYSLTLDLIAGTYSLKVTDGTWDKAWGGNGEGGNYDFIVEADGEVTVTFDGETVNVIGGVEPPKEELVINSIHVAGSAGLTGFEWDPTANAMAGTEGVYTISFENIAAGTYAFKFAANGGWDINWAAGVEMTSGEIYDAWFNAIGNSSVVIEKDGSTVTLTLDLTTMDAVTGEGGKCSVTVKAPASKGVTVSGIATSGEINITTIELIKDGVVLATAGADGKEASYAFENVTAGEYILRVSKVNHVTREYSIVVADEDVTQDVKICLIGDINGDGIINIGDAAKVYSHIRGRSILTDEYQLACANVNGGILNIGDAASLYAHVRGSKLLY